MTAPNVTARILRLIVENAPISQSDLKVRSGLSMSTVSQATNRLLAQEIVQELGLRRVSMGRPKTLLGLNPDRASVIGIQLNAERNLIVMTDLSGNLLGEQQMPSGTLTPRQLGDALAKFLRGVEEKRVGAIGLALSGLVDAENGYCIRSKVLDWDNVPIARLLEERFSLPVFIENDANAMAMAALVFGQLGTAQSAVIATYGKGIGAGIILNRQLYRGRHGKAGEIGNGLVGDGSLRMLPPRAPFCSGLPRRKASRGSPYRRSISAPRQRCWPRWKRRGASWGFRWRICRWRMTRMWFIWRWSRIWRRVFCSITLPRAFRHTA